MLQLRRICSTLLLSALLVGAQQAAFMHALAHQAALAGPQVPAADSAATPAAQAGQGDSGGESGGYCDKCFQFGHVAGGAIAHATAPFLLLAVAGEAARPRPVSALAADAPSARSRDPPAVL